MKFLQYLILVILGIGLMLVLLPLLVLIVVVLFVVQLVSGRKIVHVRGWRPVRPERPAADLEPSVPANKDVIDAEVIDLPDEPAPENRRLEESGGDSQRINR